MIGLILAALLASAQPQAVIAWAEALGEQLREFVPAGADGLVDNLPWTVENAEVELNAGCPVGCLQFAPAQALRVWYVADPALVTRHAAAIKKAEADAMALAAKAASLNGDELERRTRAIEDSTASLERRARRVTFAIRANQPPAPAGMEGRPSTVAPIKGLPVLRYTFDDTSYEPVPRGIRLEVVIGPADFKNPGVRDESMKTGVKVITVSAGVHTTAADAAADEALLRKLLESVDYEGLKKLLQ